MKTRPSHGLTTRLIAGAVSLSLILPASAQTSLPTAPPLPTAPAAPTLPANPAAGAASSPTDVAEVEPKFIWGLLINIAVRFAMTAFTSWAVAKLTKEVSKPENLARLLSNGSTAIIIPLARFAFGLRSAGAIENVTTKAPDAPLQVENGRENYQGVHVAVIGFDRQGDVTGIRPVTEGFKTGDRIKLKLLPTFEGLLVIENVNPKGERRQIYPPQDGTAVQLKSGIEVMVPLGRDQYFEFTGATGDDQLVITYRDPRSFTAPATALASRSDDDTGSNFVQETTPTTFPVIAQSLKFRHAK